MTWFNGSELAPQLRPPASDRLPAYWPWKQRQGHVHSSRVKTLTVQTMGLVRRRSMYPSHSHSQASCNRGSSYQIMLISFIRTIPLNVHALFLDACGYVLAHICYHLSICSYNRVNYTLVVSDQ
ncbi:hypothetical protein PHET_11970 [Paragonimus heterotremus]|uniref:Uncharacterized protein n=1 Tax=Paragonimus heterotremus TaxID=100268 RepID=A0A8J4WCE8_9TREM|nr:hypothetical protein PHET_11970 [Paragonimus heterotremus]